MTIILLMMTRDNDERNQYYWLVFWYIIHYYYWGPDVYSFWLFNDIFSIPLMRESDDIDIEMPILEEKYYNIIWNDMILYSDY